MDTETCRRPQPSDHVQLCSFGVRSTLYLGCIWPVVGGYLLSAYTYILQADKVVNLTTLHCANIDSPVITASWTMGVYRPQKYLFLALIISHLPPRMFWGFLYQHFYLSSNAKHARKWWYVLFCYSTNMWTWLEFISLTALTIFDIEGSFYTHAVFYATWVTGYCCYMFDNAFLHHFSGWRNTSTQSNVFFWLKVVMFWCGLSTVLSMSACYLYHANTCSNTALAVFSVFEYVLAIWNAAYYFLAYWELPDVKLGYFADFTDYNRRQLMPNSSAETNPEVTTKLIKHTTTNGTNGLAIAHCVEPTAQLQ